MPETCKKRFYKNIRVILYKNPNEKNPKYLRTASYLKISHQRKDYSPCKGYSLCKMVSLGQKLKMPKTCEKLLFRNIRVIVSKKSLKKTTNIFEDCDLFKNQPSKERL